MSDLAAFLAIPVLIGFYTVLAIGPDVRDWLRRETDLEWTRPRQEQRL